MNSTLKKALGLCLASLMLIASAACGSTPPPSSQEPAADASSAAAAPSESAAAPTGEKSTVTVMINQTWNKPSMEALAEAYESANPNITIDYQVIPDNEFGQLAKAKIASKEVPDIIMDNYQGFAKQFNLPEILVDMKDREWYGKLINKDQILIDGGAYLLPIAGSADPFGMIYNTKVYEDNGIEIPKTYEEFLAVCEKLKAAGVTPIVMTAKDTWTVGMWTVTMFPNVLKDAQGDWDKLNSNQLKYADVPGFKSALDVLNELVAKGYINEDFLSTTYDMGQDMISEGTAAMTLQGAWFISECTAKYPDTKFSMYPFPFVENPKFASGQFSGFNVFKDGKNREEALKFIDFLAQPENMAQICTDWNFIPPFNESKTELPYWINDFKANYLDKGEAPIEEMAITCAVEVGELTRLTIDMLAGSRTSEEVLTAWDAKVNELATSRQLPGWTS